MSTSGGPPRKPYVAPQLRYLGRVADLMNPALPCLVTDRERRPGMACEIKSTLAGLAEALNTLLAKGVDSDAVVEMMVGEEGWPTGLIVDVETIGADSRDTPGRKLRVIIIAPEKPRT